MGFTPRVKEFLVDLMKKPATASIWYPPNVGTLPAQVLERDLAEMDQTGCVIITNQSDRGARVEIDEGGRDVLREQLGE
jgi:hypothetical protein